ncbi:capsule assembly Wzi family protein [Chitinispirillales bacterium ANBcel5]|uniref:capsule assembly Wzi family protein n=1 Tax=Cellulosispirillum alkaliphilum TaxID=3039283 RepID=UPI002A586E3F|nr:capsule assembly Wzi family protein [Chitinispirillales bacterium ANBcel5]
MKKSIILLYILSCFNIVYSSSVISNINRFELSKKYLNSVATKISVSPPFLSLPGQIFECDLPLNFFKQEQALSFDLKFSTALEVQDKKAVFGVFDAIGQYKTPWLNARVRLNAYNLNSSTEYDFQEIEVERFISDRSAPITGMSEKDFIMPEAFLTFMYQNLQLGFGRKRLRWGPGFKGTLLHSGHTHAPFYFYHFKLDLADRIRMSAYLSGYDDEISFDRDDFSMDRVPGKLAMLSENPDQQIPTRYGAAHRVDVKFNKHFQLGIYEKVSFYGSQDLVRYANPLQMYYVGQRGGDNAPNLLGGFDFNLIFYPLRIYGEFLNDDITNFDTTGNPSKYALQLGGSWFFGDGILSEIGLEYTHVSYYTYGHYSVLNRHTFWGESLGWPWGNDQDLFHARALFRFRPDIIARVEANYWLLGEGTVYDSWHEDGRPNYDDKPYFPEDPNRIWSFILSATYLPRDWISLNMYYRPWVKNKELNHSFHTYLTIGLPWNLNYSLD